MHGAPMRTPLDYKLECKTCKPILLDIPAEATEETPIHCSTCGAYLGSWGELQDDFARQITDADALELKHGIIIKHS